MNEGDNVFERMGGLDALRGLAITSVILFHLNLEIPTAVWLGSILSWGFLGVQLFFLVSAFTMCLMWDARLGEQMAREKFWIRRLSRIAPPFWCAMVVYGVLRWMKWFPGSGLFGSWDLLATVVLLHNISPSATNLMVPGGWSIGAEVLFYVSFPYLVVNFVSAESRLILAFCMWVVGLILIPVMDWAIPSAGSDYLYYSFVTQAPVFLIGMAAYCWKDASMVSKLRMLALFGFWMLATWVVKSAGGMGRPGFWLPVLALAIFVASIDMHRNLPVFSALGRVSYSSYLSHFAIIHVFASALELKGPLAIHVFFVLASAVFASTYLFSNFSADVLEQPSARWLRDALLKIFVLNSKPIR